MLGWHVHEKAALMISIPLGLLAGLQPDLALLFFFLDCLANYSLLPLLFPPALAPLK